MNRPPDKTKARHRGTAAGLQSDHLGRRISDKPTGGRPELQGNSTGRNGRQNPPTWPAPAGTDAAIDLARCLTKWVRR